MPFKPSQSGDFSGKVYLVTGATHNAKVYLAARSEQKASEAIEDILLKVSHANISFIKLDMMDLASVVTSPREFLTKEPHLHGLIDNAGIMAAPYTESVDGYESQPQTDYLSHWLLTHHLLPALHFAAGTSTPGDMRIINVTSNGHNLFAPKGGIDFSDMKKTSGTPWSSYGMSKLVNILHARELNRLYGPASEGAAGRQIWTASVHPGSVDTTYTSLFAAASNEFKRTESGEYFVPLAKKVKPSKDALDVDLAKKLWVWAEDELQNRGFI
ncbi:NAD(P)-binding protein [Choiromyces venosus 120613-1]|uniref:NAD(P)-binding protein n=1 Tax=Choiromyces venosus 120613-1 TaxID=1336337 RepID=A0A3N4K304_9PEZI|nr:NAD(P)-binding protein [Choiromyces venosus 120613-1]